MLSEVVKLFRILGSPQNFGNCKVSFLRSALVSVKGAEERTQRILQSSKKNEKKVKKHLKKVKLSF